MFPIYKISDFLGVSKGMEHFHINRLEEMPLRPKHIQTPHKHQFYELFLVESGEANHMVDYQEYHLTTNTFFFISQGQLHFWSQSNRENIKGYRLMFTEEFFQANQMDKLFLFELIYLDNIYQKPFLHLSTESDHLIYTYFELLLKEFRRKNGYDKALQSLLFLLLFEVRRLFAQRLSESNNENIEANKSQSVIFKQFMTLLEENFNKKWTASDYADALFISTRHLNRVIQKVTNQNLTLVIQNRTVLEAKRLLTFTHLTVSQIAINLGFEDGAYFARYFRKITGCSPTDFKETLSQKYR